MQRYTSKGMIATPIIVQKMCSNYYVDVGFQVLGLQLSREKYIL